MIQKSLWKRLTIMQSIKKHQEFALHYFFNLPCYQAILIQSIMVDDSGPNFFALRITLM